MQTLDNVVENTTSAESRIRDTDMAEEMVSYSARTTFLHRQVSLCLHRLISQTQGVLSLLTVIENYSINNKKSSRSSFCYFKGIIHFKFIVVFSPHLKADL